MTSPKIEFVNLMGFDEVFGKSSIGIMSTQQKLAPCCSL